MPFSGNRSQDGISSISPTTNKSVMPFNNVPTIQDVLDGRVSIEDIYPHTRGNWAPGEDVDKSYKDKGDDYKRKERDEDILRRMYDREGKEKNHQAWEVKVPGGSRFFISFESAQRDIREKGLPFKYLSKAAQNTLVEKSRVGLIADSINKVFLVESINSLEGIKETGSAFCVGQGKFITCAHVIMKYNKSSISEYVNGFGQGIIINLIQNGRSHRAQLVDVNLNSDLALLNADIDVDPVEIDGEANIGEDIIVIGSPHGYENNVSTGTVGGLDRRIYSYEGAPQYMFIDAAVFPGSSGGPVIRIADGKIIGMITLIVSTEGEYGLNAALPSSYIDKFLNSTK